VLYPFCSFFLTKESVIHYYNEILKKTGNDFRPVDYLQERQGVGTTEKKMQLLVGRVQDLNQLLNPAP